MFRTSCFSCHSGAVKGGGLDLSNYASARASAALILSRMTNAGAPMPPGGLLPDASIRLVNAWIVMGTPQ